MDQDETMSWRLKSQGRVNATLTSLGLITLNFQELSKKYTELLEVGERNTEGTH
jgi:hypothetical protein